MSNQQLSICPAVRLFHLRVLCDDIELTRSDWLQGGNWVALTMTTWRYIPITPVEFIVIMLNGSDPIAQIQNKNSF